VKTEFNFLLKEQQTKLIDHCKVNGNYRDAWTGKKGSGSSQKNGISNTDVASMLMLHDEEKIKATDEKSALNSELMAIIADLTAKQNENEQAGASSLGPMHTKVVTFLTQTAPAEAHKCKC
jgi:hypothetical protein